MIKIQNPTQATTEMLRDIDETVFDAQDLGGARTKKALQQIVAAIEKRDVPELSRANPADVALTDEQWEQLRRKVAILAGGPSEQW